MTLRRNDPFGFSAIFDDRGFDHPSFSNTPFYALPRDTITRPAVENNNQMWQRHAGLQIHDDDKAIDVPEEMIMKLGDSNQVLHLSAGRKFQEGETATEAKFDRRFTIGTNVDVEKIEDNLSKGVLTSKAPKKEPEKLTPTLIRIAKDPASTF